MTPTPSSRVATRAITAGEAPAFIGLRFKCFEAPTRRRGIRTLDLFVGSLLAALDELPNGLVITARRLSDCVAKTGSGVQDEPATARALARYIYRGFAFGALDETELITGTGLDGETLANLVRRKSDPEHLTEPRSAP